MFLTINHLVRLNIIYFVLIRSDDFGVGSKTCITGPILTTECNLQKNHTHIMTIFDTSTLRE